MPQTISWPFRESINPNDPEFAAQVKPQLGYPYQGALDPKMAHVLETWARNGITLRGFYSPEGSKTVGKFVDELNPYLKEDANVQPGHVYTIAPGGNTKDVFAHEFRHKALGRVENEEFYNRLMDAYYADSPKAWDKAVNGYGQWLVLSGELGNIPSFEDAEKRLVSRLKYYTPQEQAKNDLAPTLKDKAKGMFSSKQRQKNEAKGMLAAPWKFWAKQEKE